MTIEIKTTAANVDFSLYLLGVKLHFPKFDILLLFLHQFLSSLIDMHIKTFRYISTHTAKE